MRSNQAGNWRRCLLSLRARIYHGTAEGESRFSRAQVTTESYDAVCTFSIRSALSSTAAIHGDAFYILVMWFFWYIRSETCPTKYRAQVLGRWTPQKSFKKTIPRGASHNISRALRTTICVKHVVIQKNQADFQVIDYFTASIKLNVFIVLFIQCLFKFFQRFLLLSLVLSLTYILRKLFSVSRDICIVFPLLASNHFPFAWFCRVMILSPMKIRSL